MTQYLEKIMEEVEINVDGITDEIKSYELTPEQYEWFLLQASKVQELELEIESYSKNYNRVMSDVIRVARERDNYFYENQSYREALEFYAGENNYEMEWCDALPAVTFDGGKIARQALKGESE